MFIHFDKSNIVVSVNNILFIIEFCVSNDDKMMYKITSYPNIFHCICHKKKCNAVTFYICSNKDVYDGSTDIIIYRLNGFCADFKITALMMDRTLNICVCED